MRKGNKVDKTRSIYRGVAWNMMQQQFKATVTYQGVTYSCGFWDTPIEAVKARDKKILALNLDVPLQIFRKISETEKQAV